MIGWLADRMDCIVWVKERDSIGEVPFTSICIMVSTRYEDVVSILRYLWWDRWGVLEHRGGFSNCGGVGEQEGCFDDT